MASLGHESCPLVTVHALDTWLMLLIPTSKLLINIESMMSCQKHAMFYTFGNLRLQSILCSIVLASGVKTARETSKCKPNGNIGSSEGSCQPGTPIQALDGICSRLIGLIPSLMFTCIRV